MTAAEPVHISKVLEDELWACARAYHDQEVCGFIDLTKQRLVPVRNVSPTPATSYRGHDQDTFDALRNIRGPFAVYHSHPTARAIPSPHDIASGTYGTQVILAPRYAELKAYRVQGRSWTEVAVTTHEPGVAR